MDTGQDQVCRKETGSSITRWRLWLPWHEGSLRSATYIVCDAQVQDPVLADVMKQITETKKNPRMFILFWWQERCFSGWRFKMNLTAPIVQAKMRWSRNVSDWLPAVWVGEFVVSRRYFCHHLFYHFNKVTRTSCIFGQDSCSAGHHGKQQRWLCCNRKELAAFLRESKQQVKQRIKQRKEGFVAGSTATFFFSHHCKVAKEKPADFSFSWDFFHSERSKIDRFVDIPGFRQLTFQIPKNTWTVNTSRWLIPQQPTHAPR